MTSCFGLTMWIHLNRGDAGLASFLQGIADITEFTLLIEIHPWKNYKSAVRRLRHRGPGAPLLATHCRPLARSPEETVERICLVAVCSDERSRRNALGACRTDLRKGGNSINGGVELHKHECFRFLLIATSSTSNTRLLLGGIKDPKPHLHKRGRKG